MYFCLSTVSYNICISAFKNKRFVCLFVVFHHAATGLTLILVCKYENHAYLHHLLPNGTDAIVADLHYNKLLPGEKTFFFS